MQSLQNAIGHPVQIDRLGKYGHDYLSFDPQKGWDVIHLNWFERIFRWIFGLYGNTHLPKIAAQLQHEPHVSTELNLKIRACWRKAYPQLPCPIAAPTLQPNPPNLGPTIVQGDLLQRPVECIVNAANEACLGGGGVDGAIHNAGGPGLLALCRALPIVSPNVRCPTGSAVITGSANLAARGIQHIIHTVGPRYSQKSHLFCLQQLRMAYYESLDLARQQGIRTLAFPAVSIGIFQFPLDEAVRIAFGTIRDYMLAYPAAFDRVEMVFLDHLIEQSQSALS